MPKVRLYEIAKEMDIPSKDLIDILKKNNVDVKSHISSVDEEDTKRIVSREKTDKVAESKTPSPGATQQPVEKQNEQKMPSSGGNPQRLNIWREDSGMEKTQRENLQKEVIRQKQQAQKETQKGDRYHKEKPGSNVTPKGDYDRSTKKTNYTAPNENRRGVDQQASQAPRSQQTSDTPQSSYNRQSTNEQSQKRQQQSTYTQQSQRTTQPQNAQQPQRSAQSPQQPQRSSQSSSSQQPQQRSAQSPSSQQPQRSSQSQNSQQPQRSSQSQNSQQPQRSFQSQNSQQPQRSAQSQNSQQPQRSAQSQNSQQPRRAGQTQGSQPSQRTSAPHTTQSQSASRSDPSRQKDFSQQKPSPVKKPTTNQKPALQQKDEFGRKGQAYQKPTTSPKMLSAQKPPVPKKRSSKKIRAAKAAEAELQVLAALPVEEDKTPGIIFLPKMISVKDLVEKLGKETGEVIKALMKRGIMANLNQEVDYYNAAQVAEDFELLVDKEEEIDLLEEAFAEDDSDSDEDKTERSPVVVVMGHVDHGKTSLLDRIRKTSVTVSEAGGITQHIGAYTVAVEGKSVTFLDTPGHEAFTAMRMRGAQVTDIAVLVVAADDGVMPQTIEAINHAKAANVEIIVAINKIDRPSANPDRVKQELADHGLLSENWGGDTICVEVSAITGEGIDNLLEMITVVAEMKELKANTKKHARGTIIEALLDKGRGPVATVLVQSGTLNIGDPVVAGATYGKIRAMSDDKGQRLKTAGPSMPVEILGLSEVPLAGDMFYVAKGDKHARVLAESVKAKGRESLMKAIPKVSLDDLFDQIQSGNVKELNLVIKADVQGSVEAVRNSLERLSNNEVRIKAIHGGVGAITESDVMLASASNAIIIGFNVRPEAPAKSVADSENVDIRLYRIIYNAIEDITAAMKGLLDPVYKEKVIGHAEIRQLFKASGVGTIAGSYVTDGKFTRNAKVRIIRNSKIVYDGALETLKRFKDDVKEVNTGYECGLLFSKYNDIKEGDMVEAYIMEEIPR